jgi:hypothetical protein
VLTGDAGVSSTDDSTSSAINGTSATAGATATDSSTGLDYSYSASALLSQPAYTVTASAAAADAPVRDYSCLMNLMKSMSTSNTAANAIITAGSALQSADGLALAVLAHMDRLSVAYCAVQSYAAESSDSSSSAATGTTANTAAAAASATAGVARPSAAAAAAVTAVLKAHSGTAHQPDGLYCVDVCADTFEQLLSLLASLQTCAAVKSPRESLAQTHVAHALLACLRVLRANLVQLVSTESCMKDSVLSLCAANSAAHSLDTHVRNSSSMSSSCNQAEFKQSAVVGNSSSSDATATATAAAASAADVHELEAKRIASAPRGLQQQLLHLLHTPPLDSTAAQVIQVCPKPYYLLSLSDT